MSSNVSPAPSMAGRVPVKVVVSSERVPMTGSKSGMFTGAPFAGRPQPVGTSPVNVSPARALPQKGVSFGKPGAGSFVPAANAQLGRALPQAASGFGNAKAGGFAPAGAKGVAMRGSVRTGPKLARRSELGGNGNGPEAQAPVGGKTTLSLEEARGLLASLEVALAPITAAEAAQEDQCLRELAAGPFPIVRRLGERLRAFVGSAGPGQTFQITHGELTVTQKALDCAASLGRAATEKAVVTAAGIGGGALALLLLL